MGVREQVNRKTNKPFLIVNRKADPFLNINGKLVAWAASRIVILVVSLRSNRFILEPFKNKQKSCDPTRNAHMAYVY